jgi:hypothetical protein
MAWNWLPSDYIEYIKWSLDICHDLDIPRLRTEIAHPPTEIPGRMDYETCFWRVAQVWNRTARVCANEGI